MRPPRLAKVLSSGSEFWRWLLPRRLRNRVSHCHLSPPVRLRAWLRFSAECRRAELVRETRSGVVRFSSYAGQAALAAQFLSADSPAEGSDVFHHPVGAARAPLPHHRPCVNWLK